MGRDSSPLRDRVIFIDGAPRSGTTWLVTLLATHPEIAGVEAESHLFDFGLDRLFDNWENRHPTLHGLRLYLDREQLVDLARDVCDGVFVAMREHVGKEPTPPFVVEKTPVGARKDGLDLERKRDCYPDAWFVHIVRDREAVTRSLMRAPFVEDRSYEACSGTWDRVVGDIRRHLGDAPRYREVAYEDLRGDPAAACRAIFEWLGLRADDEVLDVVRTLARERVSDMGEPQPAVQGMRSALKARARQRVDELRKKLESGVADPRQSPESVMAFRFMESLHEKQDDRVREQCHPSMELVLRRPEGDVWHVGEEAREALVGVSHELFGRRYVGEWWGSAGGGPGEWWSSAPGRPFFSVFFSGLNGDATRVDVAIGFGVEDELIRRAVVVTAGPLSGRPVG